MTVGHASKRGSAFSIYLLVMIGGVAAHTMWFRASEVIGLEAASQLSQRGRPVAARQPYTVRLQETTRSGSGEAKPQGVVTVALRSNGDFVWLYEHQGLVPPVVHRIIALASGIDITLDDVRERRMSVVKREGASFRARMDPRHGCIRNHLGEIVLAGESLGDGGIIQGYRTLRFKHESSTSWLAPDLGCATLQTLTEFPSGITNHQVAIAVSAGEPSSSLFTVAERHLEVPPSVFHEMDPASPHAQRMDKDYFERRPPR